VYERSTFRDWAWALAILTIGFADVIFLLWLAR
jgi:hypothetical protein